MTTLRKIAILAFAITFGATLVFAQNPTCNAATIQGSYAIRTTIAFIVITGNAGKSTMPVPATAALGIAGRYVFTATSDTEGTLTVSGQKGNFGGVPVDYPPMTGTYSVNPDCTGTITRTSASCQWTTLHIAIADGGKEIEFAIYDSSAPLTGNGIFKKM
jgi:hypothetical protein